MKLKSVRIIAGQYRGRRVLYSESDNLRPTPDRVRENLFNILQNHIPGAAVLELFAGTAAFSFEALSRGAAYAVIADKSGECIKNIKQNIDAFKLTADKYNLLHADYLYAVKMLKGKNFDIIFIDPPFESGFYTDCIKAVIDSGVARDGSVIVTESSAEKEFDLPESAECLDIRIYGTVKLQFIAPKALAPDTEGDK